jgi:hypothetical protein
MPPRKSKKSEDRERSPSPPAKDSNDSKASRKPQLIVLNNNYGHRLILSHALFTIFVFVSTYYISYFGFQTAVDTNEPNQNKWLHVPSRQVNVTDFHLSTSVDYGIARCIGSLCLPLIGAFFVLVALWRYFYVHAHLPNKSSAYTLFPHKRNNLSLICAVVGAIGTAGVGAFPSVVHKPAHFFFAFVAFGNICTYMVLQVNLDRSLKLYQLNDTEKMLHGARITLSYLGLIGLVGMITSMKVLGRKDWSSMFELTMGGAFLIYLCTFVNQAQIVQISVTAKLNQKDWRLQEGGEENGHIEIETALEIEHVDGDDEGSVGGSSNGGRSRSASDEDMANSLALKLSIKPHEVVGSVKQIRKFGGGSPLVNTCPAEGHYLVDSGGGEDGEESEEDEGGDRDVNRNRKLFSFAKKSVIIRRPRAFTQ